MLEQQLKQYQQKRFGAENGDYIRQRWQLVQPIEDQIFNIAQEIGKTKKYDYIFAKSDVASVYADQKYDITRFVQRMLNRKDNAEDRNKQVSEMLKEDFNYEFKDERTKRKEEIQRKRQELIDQRNAEREQKKKEIAAQREERERKRQEELKKRQEQRAQKQKEKENQK